MLRLLILALTLLATPAFAQQVLVVHLPSAPIEAANRLAEAANGLAAYLSAEVPELELEVQIFRRFADADAFLQGDDGARVAAVLADASFLLDAGGDAFVASHRLLRGGRGTYRRLLVVKSDAAGIEKLVDLQGRSLGVVETAGASVETFLRRAVFEGEIVPGEWFGSLERVSDDFTATAGVLYGQTEAALVAEHNPLLQSHLGGDLRTVYTSAPLSLPVLALRDGALTGDRRAAWDTALGRIAASDTGRGVVAELKIDGFEAVATEALALPQERTKTPEIALPAAAAFEIVLPPPPAARDLAFDVEVELPEIPLPAESEIKG